MNRSFKSMEQKTVLSNGVRVVTEKVPSVHSVSIGIWVKAGSRCEQAAENGIAHFLEHMLFKGTEKHTAAEIARVIDSVGGVLNAFTAKEYTCFYVKVLREHVPLAVDLLADIFFNSLLSEEELEKERNVIIQEINMVKDTPDDYVQDLFNQTYFAGHPLGYNILGDLDTVSGISRSDLAHFFEREYLVPERIIVSAAGHIEHDEFVDIIGNYFGSMQGSCSHTALPTFVPKRGIDFHERPLEQVHVCIGTPGVSYCDSARYALFILNAVSGGSMSSRLFQEVRENRGLAYSIFSYTTSFCDSGLFGIYMGVVNETLQEALRIIMGQLMHLRDEPVHEAELVHAKEQLKGNLLLSLESTDSHMSRLAKCEIYHNEYVPVEKVLQDIEAVTAGQVQDIARRIFQDDSLVFTFLGPVAEQDIPPETLLLK